MIEMAGLDLFSLEWKRINGIEPNLSSILPKNGKASVGKIIG